nr:hypothetical protein [Pseudomonas sp.]
MSGTTSKAITANLVAVLVAVTDGEPRVLTTRDAGALPAGPLEQSHRSLQAGLRAWVEQQTHHPLGYVEQLYTFADRDRVDAEGGECSVISISYLGLTRESAADDATEAGWQSWYRYFPWEDHRAGVPQVIPDLIAPALYAWARGAGADVRATREERIAITFGTHGHTWNEDMVLQRYELLYEAGLVPEAGRGRARVDTAQQAAGSPGVAADHDTAMPGRLGDSSMQYDHRRILATGIARLRAKIKYKAVVFELMPPDFTLLQLQQTVEALSGRCLHKQNFRRLMEQQALVEETGELRAGTAGRPAKLFRFRRGVMQERAIAGSKLPLARSV